MGTGFVDDFFLRRGLRRLKPRKGLGLFRRIEAQICRCIEPEPLPERQAQFSAIRQGKRDKRPAAAQRSAMTGAAGGRELLQSIKRHGGGGVRKHARFAAFDEKILIQFDRVGAGRFNEQGVDRQFLTVERIEVLQKARALAVEVEPVGEGYQSRLRVRRG